MSARERERGELPFPNLSLPDRKIGQGLFVLARLSSETRMFDNAKLRIIFVIFNVIEFVRI